MYIFNNLKDRHANRKGINITDTSKRCEFRSFAVFHKNIQKILKFLISPHNEVTIGQIGSEPFRIVFQETNRAFLQLEVCGIL